MKARAALFLAAVVLAPLAAVLRGAPGPLALRLNLGPGDEPYVAAFFPEYEIESGIALHWSRPEARLSLPLMYAGPAGLALRFGPPPGGPSRVEVVLHERPLEGFDCCRHRALQRRRLDAPASTPTPLRARVRVSGGDVGDRGLFLDWVELELLPGARVWLADAARFRPTLLVAVGALVLLAAGLTGVRAALVLAPLALLLSGGLLRDPWLVHRLLTGLPEALLLVLLPLTVLLRFALARSDSPLPAGASLALLAFLLRGAALNHPDFYYPDLMVHARLAAVAREAGLKLVRSPHAVLYTPRAEPSASDTLVRATSGLWLRRIEGVDVGLPYSLALHALVGRMARSLDGTVSVLKTTGVLFSAVPVLALAFLAPRFGLSPWWAGLLVAAPTPMVELSLGTVPATFGHALDLLFLLWLAQRGGMARRPRVVVEGALVLALIQLAYVSSLFTASAPLGLLAAQMWRKSRGAARGLVATLVLGSVLSLLAYYRDFVPGALTAVRLALAGGQLQAGAGATRFLDPGGGRVDATFAIWAFPLVAVPAAFGLVRLARTLARPLLLAWALAALALGVLRGAAPSVFGFLHFALFATPLACLAAGAGLSALASSGRRGYAVACIMLAALATLGFWLQAQALLAQLGNAR